MRELTVTQLGASPSSFQDVFPLATDWTMAQTSAEQN
jgi:hypothetical protein